MLATVPTPWNQTALVVLQAVVLSLSGVISPGAMTAAALSAGTRSRHAGLSMAVGHGIVEFPLMALILLGVGQVLNIPAVKIAIGLVGGLMMLWLAVGMLKNPQPKSSGSSASKIARSPILVGLVLTAMNPLFLLWWASVGLALAIKASSLGLMAFAAFGIIHWMCDAVWLELLTTATFKGSTLLGAKSQRVILALCGLALFVIAGSFLYGATSQCFDLFR
jgi:threonine/homoserine/homoserine lactone efflux protein